MVILFPRVAVGSCSCQFFIDRTQMQTALNKNELYLNRMKKKTELKIPQWGKQNKTTGHDINLKPKTELQSIKLN